MEFLDSSLLILSIISHALALGVSFSLCMCIYVHMRAYVYVHMHAYVDLKITYVVEYLP